MKDVDDALKRIPRGGFLKIGSQGRIALSSSQRVALIRKGNELFNDGMINQAKKVFITTGYSDGLIRIGDYYLKQQDPLEALRMYWMAPAPDRVDRIIENTAGILRKWMDEGTGKNEERTDGRDEYQR